MAVEVTEFFCRKRAQYMKCDNTCLYAFGAELIYGDANTVQKISLDQDAVYDIDTGYLTVHIEVKDGAARFIDSPCPDHICESFGWISQEDQTATCLPARAVLTIVPLA